MVVGAAMVFGTVVAAKGSVSGHSSSILCSTWLDHVAFGVC